jgi:formate hydrogenlyase subunit 5
MTGLVALLRDQWSDGVHVREDAHGTPVDLHIDVEISALRPLCRWLFRDRGYAFATFIVEDRTREWDLVYVFYADHPPALLHLHLRLPKSTTELPSISADVHAADWHEREVEDLFGLRFAGHPRLGDFVLHNDAWEEDVAPMRHGFDPFRPRTDRKPDVNWRPRRLVHAPGAFFMTIGPVFGGDEESAQFLLETVGEDVIRAFPRLFFKHRAVEKIAEGQSVTRVLQLAERFAGTTAFAHSLGFCQAVERILGISAPERAQWLRVMLAELERLRHHVGAIERICGSTALAVPTSQAAALEEELLRLSGAHTAHRYLFGLNVPGGLSRDLSADACAAVVRAVEGIAIRCRQLEDRLRYSSSFLDRLEEVGTVEPEAAVAHGLVGPVARASAVPRDLRCTLAYGRYDAFPIAVPVQREGDGLARLRQLFAEADQSAALIRLAATGAPPGAIAAPRVRHIEPGGGAALGWVEAPRGAAFHWVRLDGNGNVARYHVTTPSFVNWHGFHLAAEDFAFQDFPIILASFGLSVAECDR